MTHGQFAALRLQFTPKSLWLLIVAVGMILLAVPPLRAQAPQTLDLERTVTPERGVLDQVEIQVTLTLTGDSQQCQATTVARPADIILAIDHSSSMYESAGGGTPGTKMDALKSAAKQFIGKANLQREQIGIVEFDQGADVVQALTNNRGLLVGAIDAIEEGGRTAIEQGVIMAQRELATGRARSDASHIMIVMTDGRNSNILGAITGELERAANEAKARGIRIITIGLGADVDQDVLKSIASQPEDYFPAPQASDLERIYTAIGATILQPLAATDVVVEHTFNASALEIIPNSIQPSGVVNGDKISWTLKEILDAPIPLTYRAKPRATGNFNVDRGDKISFNRCGSDAQTFNQLAGLPISIQAPPTNTPTPTNTLSPTPRPTNTPRPTPLPTPVPPFTTQVGDTMLNLFCDSPLLPLLLLLLLLLFFICWFKKLLEERAKRAEERNYCWLIPWLLLPLFLILLWFIWNALSSSACISRDALYFWRIGEGGGNGRIFVTDREGAQPAREFTQIGTGQCTGCHSVSSASHRIAAVSGGAGGNIVVSGLDGKKVNIPQLQGSYTSWSPDGEQLAVSTTDNDIVIVDIPNQTVTKLDGASSPNEFEQMPSWSSDGQTIAFVRGQRPSSSWKFDGPTDIYTVPATGGAATLLKGASGGGFNYYPSYSPDGRWLAFTHHDGGGTTYAAPEAEIFIVPANGGAPIRLAANDAADGTPLKNVSNSWPSWSRTGEFLAFNSKRNDPSYDIFIMRVDEKGNSGPATAVPSASVKGIFEHLPFQGEPPQIDPIPALLALWPCLIPFLLVLLAWLWCRSHKPKDKIIVPPVEPARIPPGPLAAVPLEPFWQVAPTLIVGVGGTGRWVLTHLKKALRDGGAGELPDKVRFALLDTSESEETNVLYDAQGKLVGVEFAGESLQPNEILLMNQNLASIIRQGAQANDKALRDWFPYAEYRALTEPAQNLGYGTGGRRPMARAGLIDKIRRGAQTTSAVADKAAFNDAERLWKFLGDGATAVTDNNRVRIIVIGSLAGGMSGALFDVAYLARQAARSRVPGGTVTLEGYLTTEGAFHNLVQDATRLEINAMAAGRELQRFQMSRGFPFPMDYWATEPPSTTEQAYLAQVCDWRMFDDVMLFGGAATPEQGSGKESAPWATTFASMADVISFRLDSAVNAGERADYRTDLRAGVDARQENIDKAVVSSAGSYVYRLPLMDILDLAHIRWARKLFHVFLNGNAGGQEPSFDPAVAQMTVSPEEYARQFVMAEHPAGDAPRGMRTVGLIAASQAANADAVRDLATDAGRPYNGYLAHALGLILNGKQEEKILERRAPRVGYALAFLTKVREHLQKAREYAGAQSADGRLQSWIEITNRAIESLEGVKGQITGVSARGAQGLYAELQARQSKIEQRRKQMDQVAVRRYLWARPIDKDQDPTQSSNQRELADEWYAAIEPELPKYLNRFYWIVGADGNVRLGIIAFQDKANAITLDSANAESVARVANELMKLASHLTQKFKDTISLADVLVTQYAEREGDPATRLLEKMWQHATPHLESARDTNHQLDGSALAAAGVPQKVQGDERVNSLLGVLNDLGTNRSRFDHTLDAVPTRTIGATDRTALVLVREHALMPMLNLPEFQAAWNMYRRNAGSETDRQVEPTVRATVFAAERHALEYERRLEAPTLLNQDFRLLHPLIVLALARANLAELYALAFAAGWIEARGGKAILTIPGQNAVSLELPEFGTVVEPRVMGLLRMAAGKAEDTQLVTQLQNAFANPSQTTQDAWRAYLNQYRPVMTTVVTPRCVNGHEMKPGANFCGRCGEALDPNTVQGPTAPWQPPFRNEEQEVQDLAAVAALAAFHRLAPDAWDSLVMRRSRVEG